MTARPGAVEDARLRPRDVPATAGADRRRATQSAARTGALRRLALFLSMDFGVVVLFRHNRKTKRQTCIWGGGPDEAAMRRQAAHYTEKISGLDLAGVDWVRSADLLAAVNRPRR